MTPPPLEFELLAEDGPARVGRLTTTRGTTETPVPTRWCHRISRSPVG